ncbi:MAG: hypothetical protein JO269_09480 [Burkholderiaceae bacterium]|nr:hypothetical protein [Burkholderiaceae bacterium]
MKTIANQSNDRRKASSVTYNYGIAMGAIERRVRDRRATPRTSAAPAA